MQHFEVVGGMPFSWNAWGEAPMGEVEKQKQRLDVVEKAMSPPPKFTWRSSQVRPFPIQYTLSHQLRDVNYPRLNLGVLDFLSSLGPFVVLVLVVVVLVVQY